MTTTTGATAATTVVDRVLDGPHGDLPVRVYLPGTTPVAGLVWAHGGGFMHGDLDMPEADGVARALAAAGVLVVSVDYRRVLPFDEDAVRSGARAGRVSAEGVRFPVPSEEVGFAYDWALGADLGVAPERWSIGGASAGGNLAAGASLRLRDAGTPVRSTVLAYPVAHYALPPHSDELAAKVEAIGGSFPPELVAAMNDNYLGHADGPSSPYAFPGGAGDDLRGLPPTFVLTSDSDGLRSSGEAYAAELAAAGVDVLLVREDGTTHGHLNQPDHPGCARSLARIAAWLTTDALVGTSHEPAR
ncbi:MAG TPA: alpha/beta hydrolase fold domain-containing protein [Isoptericola sp.]|nr:alpha/beta hydrolase fold domain-containing protein [Isoptericola sp.]